MSENALDKPPYTDDETPSASLDSSIDDDLIGDDMTRLVNEICTTCGTSTDDGDFAVDGSHSADEVARLDADAPEPPPGASVPLPARDPAPPPVEEVAPPEPAAAAPECAAAPPAPAESSAEPEPIAKSGPSLAHRVETGLITVLRAANYPRRYLPPPVQPVVDWVALTLVFWVPIVWAIAIFVVGKRV